MKRKTNEEFLKELKAIHPHISTNQNYCGIDSEMEFHCMDCGNTWKSTPYYVLRSKYGCPKCATITTSTGRKKNKDTFISELKIVNPTIEVIGEYKNARTGIKCKCKKCGYIWEPLPTNLLKGRKCPVCSHNLKLTDAEFKKRIKSANPSIIPLDKYIDYTTKIRFKCNTCNYTWKSSPGNILSNDPHCPKCFGRIRRTHDDFVKELREKHPTIKLNGCFKALDKPTIFECTVCGNVWQTNPERVLLAQNPCRVCADRPSSLEESQVRFLKKLKEKHPSITALDPYIDIHKPIRIQCNTCGAIMEKTPDVLLRTKFACRYCHRYMQSSFPEQAFLFYIRKEYPDAISGYKDIFKNKMELDIYIPSIKTAIEYDGVHWHSTEKANQKEIRKYDICKDHGVRLIRIKEQDFATASTIDYSNKCDAIYFLPPDPDENNLSASINTVLQRELNIQEEIRVENDRMKIINCYYKSKSGKSLAEANPKLALQWHPTKNGKIKPEDVAANSGIYAWWLCENGHEWNAVVASRNSGVGCPECFNEKRKNGLGMRKTNEDFLKEIKRLGLNIEPMEQYINSTTKILVKCTICGRTWKVLPYSLIGKQHSQCIKCFGTAKKTTEEFVSELKAVHPCLELLDNYINDSTPLLFRCKTCNNEEERSPRNVIKAKYGCYKCKSI